MQKWTATCTDGFTKTLEANSKDEAVTMFMNDMDMKQHMVDKHQDLMGKTPEEMKMMMEQMVMPAAM
ncbi:hypothetical protein HY086_03585 [Candidatus Gottesmanbacteria bacterium]|nr:hypothetical protein [Candidatus Gottesmanbacteria bacterium]